MDNFSYKKSLDANSIIINDGKRKVNKQQVFFTILFVVIAFYMSWYFTKDYFITTFNGNVVTYQRGSRLLEDAYILEMNIKPGQMLFPGDTAFSFVYTKMIYNVLDPTSFTDIQVKGVELNLRQRESKIELEALISKKKELQVLIDEMEHNILIGINTQNDVINYIIEMTNVNQSIVQAESMVKVYRTTLDSIISISGIRTFQEVSPHTVSNKEFLKNRKSHGALMQYRVANDTVVVLKIEKIQGSMVFKGESVCTVYPFGQSGANTRAYIEMIAGPEFITEMSDGEQVDIYLDNKLLGTGVLSMYNVYIEEVESSKLGAFATGKDAAIVRVNINDLASWPLKYHMDNLPVKIKYYREPRTKLMHRIYRLFNINKDVVE